jgi:hypothetical protein
MESGCIEGFRLKCFHSLYNLIEAKIDFDYGGFILNLYGDWRWSPFVKIERIAAIEHMMQSTQIYDPGCRNGNGR